MKVKKESLDISNKKKSALPSSKLLKPKKFKSSLKKNVMPLTTDKVNLISRPIHNDDNLIRDKSKKLKNPFGSKEKIPHISSRIKNSNKVLKESKPKNISKLFDFDSEQKQNDPKAKDESENSSCPKGKRVTKNKSFKKQFSNENNEDIDLKKKTKDTGRKKTNMKANNVSTSQKQSSKGETLGKDVKGGNNKYNKTKKALEEQHLLAKDDKDQKKENETTEIDKCKLKVNKVSLITEQLLKLVNETTSIKPEILDVGEPVFLLVECIKIPICPTKQLRFKLPHPLVNETSDVLLITADLKGQKIYPDKAVDHYEELFAKLQIDFINKVMPLRMVKKEYGQYEMKRKLVDQFDIILADSRIIKSLPSALGKFVLYKRKMPIPVNLTMKEPKLKKHLQDAICKTQMTVKSNGHASIVQVGHTKMSGKEIAANIVEVAKSMEKLYPGGWANVRCLVVKTAKSISLPVYLSLLSPNAIRIPVEVREKPPPVEDELSTMPGFNVIVTADGKVILKKIEEDLKIDNSKDDEILEEAEKYLESSKTVRYDESSDEDKKEEKEDSDSDDEGEAITEAMEKKLLNKYEKNAKAKKKNKGEESDEEEEEEESEEETEIVPMIGNKRKSLKTKKPAGPPAKKASNSVESKGKNKATKPNVDSKKSVSPGFKKPQMRGARGGKKNKMSKDQRKAMIKRKKAGKK